MIWLQNCKHCQCHVNWRKIKKQWSFVRHKTFPTMNSFFTSFVTYTICGRLKFAHAQKDANFQQNDIPPMWTAKQGKRCFQETRLKTNHVFRRNLLNASFCLLSLSLSLTRTHTHTHHPLDHFYRSENFKLNTFFPHNRKKLMNATIARGQSVHHFFTAT